MPVADRTWRVSEIPLGSGDHASRGSTAVSFASPAMAATPLSRSCPIRIISVHLLDPADVKGPDYPSKSFRVLKTNDLRQFGEYRTQRLVLEAWDRLFGG